MNNNLPEKQNSLQLQSLSPGLLFLSFAVYFYSLSKPAYHMGEGQDPSSFMSGIAVLFWGTFSLLDKEFYWLANPALWLTWAMYFSKTHNFGSVFGIASVLIAGSFLLGDKVLVGCWDSCNYSTYHVEQGYYFWLTSMILAAAANIINLFCNKK